MRFIDKTETCSEFETYIADNKAHLGKWNLPTDIKNTLHNHILKQQKGLCIYCQQWLFEKKEAELLPPSMVEHIRPRKKRPELTYEFTNLAVACKKYIDKKGVKDTKILTPEDIDFCEDKKDDEYDETLFLHPHEITDIEDYFEYDTEGKIFAKDKNEFAKDRNEKAQYMIEIALNLNHRDLQNMRKIQLDIYAERDLFEVIEELNDIDVSRLPKFYSMLKQFYQV
ncbi:MAG: retron system putative HNH endonuclease [Methylococcaceae bacterium]